MHSPSDSLTYISDNFRFDFNSFLAEQEESFLINAQPEKRLLNELRTISLPSTLLNYLALNAYQESFHALAQEFPMITVPEELTNTLKLRSLIRIAIFERDFEKALELIESLFSSENNQSLIAIKSR